MPKKIIVILPLIISIFTPMLSTINIAAAQHRASTPNQKPPSINPNRTRRNFSPFNEHCEPDSKMFIGSGIDLEKIPSGMVINPVIAPETIAPGMIIPCPKSSNFNNKAVNRTPGS